MMRREVYLYADTTNKNSLPYNCILIMPEKSGICKRLLRNLIKNHLKGYYSNPTPFLPGSEPAGDYWLPHVASSTLREPKSPAEPDPNKTIAAFE
jgi:hypothetical protein